MRSLLVAILLVGCGKSDSKPAPASNVKEAPVPSTAPASAPSTPSAQPAPSAGPAPAAASAPALEAGEEIVKLDEPTFANPYSWVTGGKTISLTLTAHREDPKAWTRLFANGKEVIRIDDENFAYTHYVTYAERPDGKLLVVLGDNGGSGDPGNRRAYLLAPGDEVKIEQQWAGDDLPDDKQEPAWAKSDVRVSWN